VCLYGHARAPGPLLTALDFGWKYVSSVLDIENSFSIIFSYKNTLIIFINLFCTLIYLETDRKKIEPNIKKKLEPSYNFFSNKKLQKDFEKELRL